MTWMLSVTPTLIKIIHAAVTDDTLSIDLEDGRSIEIPIGWYPRLAYGSPAERANFQITVLVMGFTGDLAKTLE